MNRLKIIVVGNSVSMRVRPPTPFPTNQNYSVLLQGLLENDLDNFYIQVDNKAKGALLIRDVLCCTDMLVREFPQYYILNFGVVDASTREVPYWFYQYTNKIVKNKFEYFFSGLHAHLFMKHRPFFVNLRRRKSWVSENDFVKYFALLISTLLKETNARIISLPINPANERVEKLLPGSRKKHLRYNEHIKNITIKHSQLFMDTNTFINQQDYPDGVHYSHSGHQLIASKLRDLIINDLKIIH